MTVEQITIEIVYALPKVQSLLAVVIDEGTTVEQAIIESGVCLQYPEINLTVNKVGIWNKATKLSQVLVNGDRIEIYRPLLADPKEVRKRRADKAKAEGRADKTTGGRIQP